MLKNSNGSLFWAIKLLSFTSSNRKKRNHIRGSAVITAVSVIPLVLVIILANGMTSGITEKYIDLQSGHIRIYSDDIGVLSDASGIVNGLKDDYPIRNIFEIAEGFGILYSSDGSFSTTIKGVTNVFLQDDEVIDEFVSSEGTISFSGSSREIIISRVIAEKLKVSLGSRIAVAAGSVFQGETSFRPQIREVSGIIETGYRALDEQLVFLEKESMDTLFKYGQPESSTGTRAASYSESLSVSLSTGNLAQAIDTADVIRHKLSDTNAAVTSWNEMNVSLFRTFAETKNILYLVMALIIVITGVNISSTCIMLIQENNTNIGIMKAIGASNSQIKNAFIIALVSLSGISAAIGIGIGLLVGMNFNFILAALSSTGLSALEFYLITIPIEIKGGQILLVYLFTLLVSFTSIQFPVMRLRKISPLRIIG